MTQDVIVKDKHKSFSLTLCCPYGVSTTCVCLNESVWFLNISAVINRPNVTCQAGVSDCLTDKVK